MDQLPISSPPYFDAVALREELTATWRDLNSKPVELRASVLKRLKTLKSESRQQAKLLLERTRDGLACASALAVIQDEIIKLIYDYSIYHVYRSQNPSAAERIGLVATGGYGRRLMAPGSDIDLLFLLPYKQTAWGESIAESVLYFLWDLGYKVGHATRTVEQTLRAANDDMTTRTALLDARLVHGDVELYQELRSRFISNVVQGSQREFIEAKLEEREQRLRRKGISRYRVEPNIKEGKGGLRDLNMLHWFAIYLNPAQRSITEAKIFTEEEAVTFQHCEAFLWTVRCHLHFYANKAEERLSFDVQPEIAQRLRYKNRGGLLSVERFMKHYFLIAKDVGDLTRIVCSSLELRQLKTVPSLSELAGVLPWSPQAKLAAKTDFRVDNLRLNVKQPDVFQKDPLNLLQLYVEAERNNLLLHPEAIRLVRASLRLIDDDFRADPEANRLFLELLTSREAPENALRLMNEAGVLGRFIPEFGRIVAMMQFNMYHHFTIDEHLIRAIGILSQIEKGALGNELPLSSEIITNIQNRRALYVALLMHDVAKGLEEDHSIAGARMARNLALRLGLSESEAETAAWLVEYHLVMSQFAQSRDISDQKTIRDFANIVQSPERLKLLLLLTVADIRAVGPGVWNGWKGQLLRSLYYDTEPMLAGGHTKSPRRTRVAQAQAKLRGALREWPLMEVDHFIQRFEADYWLKTDVDRQVTHAMLIRRFEKEKSVLAFDAKTDGFLTQTELSIVTRDNPRLLMILAGACAAAGANITSAQISTTKDGLAIDTLTLHRLFSDEEELDRAHKISRTIEDILQHRRDLTALKTVQAVSKLRLDAFRVPPDVIIDNTASDDLTVIEVQALDRPGLLFDLARALSELGLDISSAHIATFGEKAVDVFYVTDQDGQKITDNNVKLQIRKNIMMLFQGNPE